MRSSCACVARMRWSIAFVVIHGVAGSSPWVTHYHEGKPYYYNQETRQTTWDLPPELRQVSPAPAPSVPEAKPQSKGGGWFGRRKEVSKETSSHVPEVQQIPERQPVPQYQPRHPTHREWWEQMQQQQQQGGNPPDEWATRPGEGDGSESWRLPPETGWTTKKDTEIIKPTVTEPPDYPFRDHGTVSEKKFDAGAALEDENRQTIETKDIQEGSVEDSWSEREPKYMRDTGAYKDKDDYRESLENEHREKLKEKEEQIDELRNALEAALGKERTLEERIDGITSEKEVLQRERADVLAESDRLREEKEKVSAECEALRMELETSHSAHAAALATQTAMVSALRSELAEASANATTAGVEATAAAATAIRLGRQLIQLKQNKTILEDVLETTEKRAALLEQQLQEAMEDVQELDAALGQYMDVAGAGDSASKGGELSWSQRFMRTYVAPRLPDRLKKPTAEEMELEQLRRSVERLTQNMTAMSEAVASKDSLIKELHERVAHYEEEGIKRRQGLKALKDGVDDLTKDVAAKDMEVAELRSALTASQIANAEATILANQELAELRESLQQARASHAQLQKVLQAKNEEKLAVVKIERKESWWERCRCKLRRWGFTCC